LRGAARFGVLVNPENPFVTESYVEELQTAASALGRQIEVVSASTNGDIDTAFATLVKKRADALLISPDALFVTRRVQLIMLAVQHMLPALYHRRELAETGGLMSYGLSLAFHDTGLPQYVASLGQTSWQRMSTVAPGENGTANMQLHRAVRIDHDTAAVRKQGSPLSTVLLAVRR
jgi:hypothetical protein